MFYTISAEEHAGAHTSAYAQRNFNAFLALSRRRSKQPVPMRGSWPKMMFSETPRRGPNFAWPHGKIGNCGADRNGDFRMAGCRSKFHIKEKAVMTWLGMGRSVFGSRKKRIKTCGFNPGLYALRSLSSLVTPPTYLPQPVIDPSGREEKERKRPFSRNGPSDGTRWQRGFLAGKRNCAVSDDDWPVLATAAPRPIVKI